MTTAAQLRKIALALPGAEEKSHFGQADFRVRDKIFCGLSSDGKRGTLKLTPELQSMLLTTKSGAYSPSAGAWGARGWTHVDLARVHASELAELIGEAFRLVAPRPKPKKEKKKVAPATKRRV